MTLQDFFAENKKSALAFSGGVDSAYLLYAALQKGADIKPYFVKTEFQPDFEFQDAQRLCSELNVKLEVIELSVLDDKTVAANPQNRCYYCKYLLFSALVDRAKSDGYQLMLDGNNASDDAADRAGMRAVEELGIRSPLRECGLTKPEIREKSRKAGLFTWDKPAYACLATRIPSGREINAELLKNVQKSEDKLRHLGFTDFRVRVYHDAARVQLPESQFQDAFEKRGQIIAAIKPHFPIILLDLESR